jgi:hypothetical protein
VPVTARLSGKFYEQFGDEITNEFVDWFNAVDSTYQMQLKEVNDLNWAKMQARFEAFDARMDAFEARIDGRLEKIQRKMLFWMFGFWSATVIPIIGVMLGLSGVFHR